MAKYRCPMCGWIYDEDVERDPFSSLDACLLCGTPASEFFLMEPDEDEAALREVDEVAARKVAAQSTEATNPDATSVNPLAIPDALRRNDPSIRHMATIHALAEHGSIPDGAMATELPLPKWEDILVLGAQLDPMPLQEGAEVDLTTVIGPRAARPLVLDGPAFVSHMSFGALSAEAKIALARGASAVGTAMCSGEGGILPAEMEASTRYIFEYAPNAYSVTDENLRASGAVEIKIGQGTKPGMGGHLPGAKVTEEIARIRGREPGKDIISSSTIPGIETVEDLQGLIDDLRTRSKGASIGIKLAAGHIERDVKAAVKAGADFITIDGRGGATGASPVMLRDASSVPTIFALVRARHALDEFDPERNISLVITGGLRVATDIVKALAMGADAVALASASLMALGCQQYRICGSGRCPMGIATQDPELRAHLNMDAGAKRVENFYRATFDDLRMFCRVMGHDSARKLSPSDLVTTDRDIAEWCGIAHV